MRYLLITLLFLERHSETTWSRLDGLYTSIVRAQFEGTLSQSRLGAAQMSNSKANVSPMSAVSYGTLSRSVFEAITPVHHLGLWPLLALSSSSIHEVFDTDHWCRYCDSLSRTWSGTSSCRPSKPHVSSASTQTAAPSPVPSFAVPASLNVEAIRVSYQPIIHKEAHRSEHGYRAM